ncbi:MAG: 50S ribosomal protein L13 [Bdellovibrionaceae bacterium]|nr:50S ribosomal protein L13 [Pseudobdellovibrionaceae bacterium]|tara:strand:- start:123634 stop:124080 length:447 start_codon:yes stop_codon:yes gene_type:complete
MKTWIAKPEEVDRKWWVVDAADQTVGRIATQIANKLRGKDKPQFTPHVDTGDFVVVINSDKIRFSSDAKAHQKKYYSHSRHFGSLKEITAEKQIQKDSTKVIESAVKGMLPKNRLARKQLKKLKIYSGTEHPHGAQKPQALAIQTREV